MPVIRTNVTVEQHDRLRAMAKAKGFNSVNALFLHEVGVAPKQDDATVIVEEFLRVVQVAESSTEFRVRDVFAEERWLGFSVGARLKAGKIILAYAEAAGAIYGFTRGRKSSANHQYYKINVRA